MMTLNVDPPPAAPETLEGGAVLHRLAGLPELDEPLDNIARGCPLALGGIAAVLFELEGEVMGLEDLLYDDDGSERDYYESKICKYKRTISALSEAREVLEELADSVRATASVGDFAEICAEIIRARGNPT